MAELEAKLLDLSEAAYHADPCPAPSISSSIANVLLDRSPQHAYRLHPKLGGARREPTDTLDRGSLIHKLVLGEGAEIQIVQADDWRTKAAKEAREEARGLGQIPVLAGAYDDACAAAEAITRNLRELGIELVGKSEVTVVWQEETESGLVWVRARLDHLRAPAVAYDLKSTRCAHPKDCARAVVNYGYDLQRAMYVRGLERVFPQAEGRIDYTLLFVEHEPPYAVTPARLGGVLRERGERRWRRALNEWAACLRSNRWPGYADGEVYLEAPAWLASQEEQEELR